jgi:D-alanine--poly(phosphoribitol) ligase subunit 1
MIRDRSVWDVFFKAQVRHENRPALWVNGNAITYGELYHRAAKLAAMIHAGKCCNQGTSGGSHCGILVNRTPTAYNAVLAALMAGVPYVPFNPKFPPGRLQRILRASSVGTLIIDDRSLKPAQELLTNSPRSLNVLLPDTSIPDWALTTPHHKYFAQTDIASCPPLSAPISSEAEQGAYLLFTSGSTGEPKGVLITQENLLAYLDSVTQRYRPGPDDRFSQLFDFSFDLSVHDMFLCWSAGACLYCAPENNIIGIANFLRRCSITFWFSVPSVAAFMARTHMLRPGSYETLRWSLFCGEVLPTRLARKWQEAAPRSIVENLYGPTEATIAFTAFRVPRGYHMLDGLSTIPIGWPLPGQQTIIIDSEGNPLPEGEPGELCLGGSQVAAGYWHSPDLTAQKFRAPRHIQDSTGWYRTGDRAAMTAKHGLVFLGRADRQVKILGHRVELEEVESALRTAATSDIAAAIAWPFSGDGIALGIVGFLPKSCHADVDIIAACRRMLPDYMVPRELHRLSDWPLSANGKTSYTSLYALLEGEHVSE